MSRMSWHSSVSDISASPAALRARPSSVSLKSTPVVSQPRRANSTECRPKPQGASSTRAPASSPTRPPIHCTSLAASVPDSTDCEICGHASRKKRSLWNTWGIIFPFMTTLVTGAFGCIGAWVVRGLLAAGERPVVYDLGDDPWRIRMIAGADAPDRMVMVRGDITDRERLARAVREHAIRRVIHLAAWQVPLCRQDPPRGAAINVVGTANVFDIVRAAAGQIERVVYVSSAAVFGAPGLYPPGPIKDDAAAHPATHYGVYKVANEETARVYWEEHRIPSSGFRPLTVYGPGRDFGLTADPTLAMKAAVLGRPFQIRWGGATDLIYTEDVARALWPRPARGWTAPVSITCTAPRRRSPRSCARSRRRGRRRPAPSRLRVSHSHSRPRSMTRAIS